MKQLVHYLALVIILTLGFLALITFRYHPLRPVAIILTAAAYFVWGILHHLSLGTLHRQVVLEYFSLAILGGIIIATLL
ncbi:MAG: hypothetical protein A2784_01835 [Candidatus Chisholmbacteria bacterium RIFCSPHIGHO2_01_FULL_48_12]|uniref:Uncharacterized protein n=1 Tax=Candidatus Chisholmbacteria bacterium RIFCSPHIGHO2_01_FULL_48_12 TaxID=1797589 RepID=A0A1G1VR97_9BACT|nr:MAG: hypothetical protein A2784_01835 [Candidatus Chisholmbacteria bacterium RIFCSPHIGHO2_01_FULL_48_12]